MGRDNLPLKVAQTLFEGLKVLVDKERRQYPLQHTATEPHPPQPQRRKLTVSQALLACYNSNTKNFFQGLLILNPPRVLWALSPWKSQIHLISTETPTVIYPMVKHWSAGPSIQPEIQWAERKENLHGEKQRQKPPKDS